MKYERRQGSEGRGEEGGREEGREEENLREWKRFQRKESLARENQCLLTARHALNSPGVKNEKIKTMTSSERLSNSPCIARVLVCK